MKTEDTVRAFQRHLRALLRAELLIAEIKLGVLLRKTALVAFAGVIAVFGLATLNIAAYNVLAPIWGEVWALAGAYATVTAVEGIPSWFSALPQAAQ